MPPDGPEEAQGPAPLGPRLPGKPTALDVAEATTALWSEIDTCLQPILGAGGVAALYHRSLSQVAAAHPGLVLQSHAALAGIDLPLLHKALMAQPAASAAAAAQAWFVAFHDLLASLVGQALTETLLRAVWHTRNPPAQDTSP